MDLKIVLQWESILSLMAINRSTYLKTRLRRAQVESTGSMGFYKWCVRTVRSPLDRLGLSLKHQELVDQHIHGMIFFMRFYTAERIPAFGSRTS